MASGERNGSRVEIDRQRLSPHKIQPQDAINACTRREGMAQDGKRVTLLIPSSCPLFFLQPHVPEDGGGKRQHAFDVRPIGRGQRSLAPRHVRHLFIGEALDLVRQLLLLGRVLGAGPLR